MKRTCKKCGETKEIEAFPISDSTRGYRRHECGSCMSLRKVDYYNANRDEIRAAQNSNAKARYRNLTPEQYAERAAWQRAYLVKHRNAVIAAYGSKCACCGETEQKFLTIDHVHNDGHMARKNKLHPHDTLNFYRWLAKHGFPSDFQLLCMNCNFGKSRNNGVCPHQEGSTTIPKGSTTKRSEVPRTLRLVSGR